MTQLAAHEFLHIQEHIRSEIAAAESCKQILSQIQDPQLKQFVESQIQSSETISQQLTEFLQG